MTAPDRDEPDPAAPDQVSVAMRISDILNP